MTRILPPADLSFFDDWPQTKILLNYSDDEFDSFYLSPFAYFGWKNWRKYQTYQEYLEAFWEYLESLGFRMVPEIGSTYSETLLVDAVKKAFIKYKKEFQTLKRQQSTNMLLEE